MIVEYKLHVNERGNKFMPYFIKDGGYYPVGNKLVGSTVDNGSYIPSTLIVLDKAALITRLTNSGYTVRDDDRDEFVLATAEQIEADVDAFISRHG
jgi:hypothetical protein|tara:strand:+ start:145 stop:432 length:288 start_codon:yes stop_codon:yes gene_type:complete